VTSFEVGRWIAGSDYFKGIVDEVRIYSRALDLEEIRAVMNAPIAGSHPGLSGSAIHMEIPQEDSEPYARAAIGDFVDRSPDRAPTVLPAIDIRLKQHVYEPGETVSAANYWISNPSGHNREVEVKTWLATSGRFPTYVGKAALDGLITLPAALDQDLGPCPLFSLGADFKEGSYEFNTRVIDPITGDTLAQDVNSFIVTREGRISGARPPASLSEGIRPIPLLDCRRSNLEQGCLAQMDGYRITNIGDQSVALELKVWFETPGSEPIPLFALGGDRSLVLPAGSELSLDALASLLPEEQFAVATCQLRVRVLDWTTGDCLCESTSQLMIP